jgi:hypothetical protein
LNICSTSTTSIHERASSVAGLNNLNQMWRIQIPHARQTITSRTRCRSATLRHGTTARGIHILRPPSENAVCVGRPVDTKIDIISTDFVKDSMIHFDTSAVSESTQRCDMVDKNNRNKNCNRKTEELHNNSRDSDAEHYSDHTHEHFQLPWSLCATRMKHDSEVHVKTHDRDRHFNMMRSEVISGFGSKSWTALNGSQSTLQSKSASAISTSTSTSCPATIIQEKEAKHHSQHRSLLSSSSPSSDSGLFHGLIRPGANLVGRSVVKETKESGAGSTQHCIGGIQKFKERILRLFKSQ